MVPDVADSYAINLYSNYDPLGRYLFGNLQFNF